MTITELFKKQMEKGDFKNLKTFDFYGVYVLCDKDEIVYVGSAYVKKIKERLKQYTSEKDTGNTLGKAIAMELANTDKFDEKAREKMKEAVDKISKFDIYAIRHEDLEYKLIHAAKPIYNYKGNRQD